MPRWRAAATSGFDSATADEMTTRSACLDVGRVVPEAIFAPRAVRRSVFSLALLVAAGDLEGRRKEEDLGEAAHPDAARADEVQPPQPQEPQPFRPPVSASKRRPRQTAGGVRHGERPRGLSHSHEALPVAEEVSDGRRQDLSREPGLLDQPRRPRLDERAGVLELVAVRRRAEGNENRGTPGRGELGERQRAGPREDEVRPGELLVDPRQERRRAANLGGDLSVAPLDDPRSGSRPVWWMTSRPSPARLRAASTIARFRTARALASAEDEQAPRPRGGGHRRDREELGAAPGSR